MAPAAPPAASGRFRWVRHEPDAIGWGLLLFVALLAAIGITVAVLVKRIPGMPNQQSPLGLVVNEGIVFLVVLLATAIMGRVEGRSVIDYGLRDSRWLPRFAAGAAWGFVLVSGLIGLLYITGTWHSMVGSCTDRRSCSTPLA